MTKTNKIHVNSEWGIILFSIMLVGCIATVAQVLLIREFLVVFFGNELCIGIVLGTWLMGVALGALLGVKIATRRDCTFSLLIISLFALCITLPLEVIFIRTLRYIFHIPAGQYMQILQLLLSSMFLIMTFSITIGFIFPIICKVIHGFTRDPAADIGFVYFSESIGSLIGGVLFTFVLVTRFSPMTIIISFDGILLITIVLLLLFPKNGIREKQSTLRCYGLLTCAILLTAIFILIVTGGAKMIDNYFIQVRWNSLNPGIELVESTDSRHENIAIGVRDGQYSVFGNGQHNFSFPDDYASSHIAHLVMTQHPNPKKVLLIGGGRGGLIREMLKHPINTLHYIELDPELITITQKYLPHNEAEVLSDKRVKIFRTDGRRFVKQSKEDEVYDLIFVNIPDPSTSFINRFYTLQFFQEVSHILNSNGIFVLGITSAVNYIGEEVGNYAGSVYQSLHTVFPHILVSPGQENFFFASHTSGNATFDVPELIKRYTSRSISSEYFSEYLFSSILPPERVTFLEKRLKENSSFKVNSDAKPVTYFYNLMLWDKFSGARLGKTLEWLEEGNLKVFLIPIFLFLLSRYLYVILLKRGVDVQQKFNCLTVIATTGFTGISLEIMLIFSFQNIYGYVYEKIGLIISLFMLGLAISSYVSNRMILQGKSIDTFRPATLFRFFQHFFKPPQDNLREVPPAHADRKIVSTEVNWIKTLLLFEIILVFYAAILPLILHRLAFQFFGSEYVFLLFVVITGILTGVEFPISSKLHFLQRDKVETTAGAIDSADHVGGFVGALLVGVLFVPLFGILGSCLIVMALKLVSTLLLLHLYFQKRNTL
ncbi:MAG: hypothetical protein D8M57_05965 [Candidatus Scalindua sp. AMX11]|nr:MAG: hypothetical protein DWQ00_12915 [Candidatus Scalindua sp.]NOG82886.1 fused MFS/spermidine synthase [Planctomycetota bacterium]RZV86227.1 MAG: hypothetical protein EX341_07630 [Candidatus Scalindua sp. SCAELEC01]TDE65848.1 MAG: hypothetical protein D8M57_05965 [Candidatus Scalindua sp. AMX11]GJQ58356.1 MAG: hypothetical protein SCALA701_11570 [Candidatus Scalindua sp.]